ncbi:hypothetical protein JW960_24165 [candidate division KSB1 bacterium]|nr:hypothetical protein [candidate division KSB1 bacterium]
MDSQKKDNKLEQSTVELSEEDLEMVLGGIMSEIVIRETIKNIHKIDHHKNESDNLFIS